MQHTDQAVSTHPERFQCRHIFTGGHRCGSPALRKEQFCFFHHTTRVPIRNPRERQARRATFDLPLVEDRSSIQLAIAQILCRIASNELDPRRAGLLLYGLQIASLNLGKSPAASLPDQTVEEVVQDPDLGPLAPVAQFQTAKHGKTLEQILLEEWAKEKQLQQEDQDSTHQPRQHPATSPDEEEDSTTLPSLQAAHSAGPEASGSATSAVEGRFTPSVLLSSGSPTPASASRAGRGSATPPSPATPTRRRTAVASLPPSGRSSFPSPTPSAETGSLRPVQLSARSVLFDPGPLPPQPESFAPRLTSHAPQRQPLQPWARPGTSVEPPAPAPSRRGKPQLPASHSNLPRTDAPRRSLSPDHPPAAESHLLCARPPA